MHFENIDHVTINIHGAAASEMFAGVDITSLIAGTPSRTHTSPPAIGEEWEGQGGIYCGIARGEDGQPDYHLILAVAAPTQEFTWKAAQEYAKGIAPDGHDDFALPTRFESALLYANVRDKLDTSCWHWTGTQSSELSAFSQDFDYGDQSLLSKKYEGRARFVRRSSVL